MLFHYSVWLPVSLGVKDTLCSSPKQDPWLLGSSFPQRQRYCLNPLNSSLDEYDLFILAFEQTLQDDHSSRADVPPFFKEKEHDDNKDKTESVKVPVELSDHYRRDYRDTSNMPIDDPVGLSKLLKKRFKARTAKHFAKVTTLDRQLWHEHGVRAYDHPRIWTRITEPPAAHARREAAKRATEMKRRYGPNGHAHNQIGTSINPMLCPLSMRDVHVLLSRRALSQLNGRLKKADANKFELLIQGIQIRDDPYLWTADPAVDLERLLKENHYPELPSRAAVFTPNSMSEPLGEAHCRIDQRIEQLVKGRAECLVRGETQLSQFILFELYRTYDVGIDDISRTWSVGAIFDTDDAMSWKPPSLQEAVEDSASKAATPYPPLLFSRVGPDSHNSPPFRQSIHSLPLEDGRVIDRVTALVRQRLHKREEGKFLEADAIRNELWITYVSTVNAYSLSLVGTSRSSPFF